MNIFICFITSMSCTHWNPAKDLLPIVKLCTLPKEYKMLFSLMEKQADRTWSSS